MFANAGENIEHFAAIRFRVLDAVGREERQLICTRKINQFAINPFFSASEMPLDFDENIFTAKCGDQRSRMIHECLGSAAAPPALFGAPAEKPRRRVPRAA